MVKNRTACSEMHKKNRNLKGFFLLINGLARAKCLQLSGPKSTISYSLFHTPYDLLLLEYYPYVQVIFFDMIH